MCSEALKVEEACCLFPRRNATGRRVYFQGSRRGAGYAVTVSSEQPSASGVSQLGRAITPG